MSTKRLGCITWMNGCDQVVQIGFVGQRTDGRNWTGDRTAPEPKPDRMDGTKTELDGCRSD